VIGGVCILTQFQLFISKKYSDFNFNFIHKKDSNLNFNHEFNPIFQAQLVGLIAPSYLKVSIGDTREHPIGVYPEKESLYFNIT
jgi:hypothetical protein